MSTNDLDKMSKEEYDVDTGTYMEDVHANDGIIGRDADSDGLIDNVEKLVEEAEVRAKEYNEEKARQERERDRGHEHGRVQEQDEKEETELGM